MFGDMGRKGSPEGIQIVKETPPWVCGGTDAYLDTKAPKKIESEEMVLFNATSSFAGQVCLNPERQGRFSYVSAYAVPSNKGSFMYLQTKTEHRGAISRSWALVKDDVFPMLVELVKELDLARNNGKHSTTHGLPENFGGDVDIRYASGEKISYSDNQCPIMSSYDGQRIADAFMAAMEGERVDLPDTSDLREVLFREDREDDGFTEARLVLNGDGTGTNYKRSQYKGTGVFESEKPVDADTIAAIKGNIASSGMLAWEGLPENDYKPMHKAEITFSFDGGRSVSVKRDTAVPYGIGNAFFSIELEMTTKH